MLTDHGELVRVETAAFAEDVVRDSELPDVVQRPADPQERQARLLPAEPPRNRLGDCGHAG